MTDKKAYTVIEMQSVKPDKQEITTPPKLDKADPKNASNTDLVMRTDIGQFYNMKKELAELVHLFCDRYQEIVWLSSKTNVTPEGIVSKDQKLSVQIFGETHIEFDKTIVSILCLMWIMGGDYESFVACQKPQGKLTQASFNELQKYVRSISQSKYAKDAAQKFLQTNKQSIDIDKLAEVMVIEALVVFTVLNDLGKVESVIQLVRAKTAIEEVDHDKILWMGLKTNPQLFPSYQSLALEFRHWLLEGLGAQFNFAQFVQAESVPASLNGLKDLDKMSLDLFNLHALFDMAGAAGHSNFHGSVVLTESTFQDTFKTIHAIGQIANGATVTQVYDSYLYERGKELGLNVTNPTQRALIRICCNLRYHRVDEAKNVIKAYKKLPRDVWNTLRKELCVTGVDDGIAILLYYAPALYQNYQSAAGKHGIAPDDAVVKAMTAMSKCFQVAREHITKQQRHGNGVFTADIADVANLAKTIPNQLLSARFVLNPVGDDGTITAKFDQE